MRKVRTLVLLEANLRDALDKKRRDNVFKVSMSLFIRGLVIAGARAMKIKLPEGI